MPLVQEVFAWSILSYCGSAGQGHLQSGPTSPTICHQEPPRDQGQSVEHQEKKHEPRNTTKINKASGRIPTKMPILNLIEPILSMQKTTAAELEDRSVGNRVHRWSERAGKGLNQA